MINRQSLFPLLIVAAISIIMVSSITMNAMADRNNKPHDGNNGQCRKLNKTFPEEIQDLEGCHDSFTGKGHNDDDEPLP